MRIRITEIGPLLLALRGFMAIARGAAEARTLHLTAPSCNSAAANGAADGPPPSQATALVTATDTGDGAALAVGASVEIPGEVSMLADALAMLLERVPRGPALLSVDGRRVTLSRLAGGFWRAVGTTTVLPRPNEPGPAGPGHHPGSARGESEMAGIAMTASEDRTAVAVPAPAYAKPAPAAADPLARVLCELGIRIPTGKSAAADVVRPAAPGEAPKGVDIAVQTPSAMAAAPSSSTTTTTRECSTRALPRTVAFRRGARCVPGAASAKAIGRVPSFRRSGVSPRPPSSAPPASASASASIASTTAPRPASRRERGKTPKTPPSPKPVPQATERPEAQVSAPVSAVPSVSASAVVSLRELREALGNVVFPDTRCTPGESIGVTLSGKSLRLVGVDADGLSSVSVDLAAECSVAGSWAAPGRALGKALRAIGKGPERVVMTFDGSGVTLQTSPDTVLTHLRTTWRSSPRDPLPVVGTSFRTERLPAVLRRAASVLATQNDPTGHFAGVLVDETTLVVTDGRRMHRYQLGEKLPRMHVSSSHVLKVLRRMGTVEGICGEEAASFTEGRISVRTVIDGRFPPYAKLFEAAATCPFVLPITETVRQEWRQKLPDLPVPESQAIRIRLNGRIEMSSQDERGATGSAVVEAALSKGQEVQLFLSKRYLDDLLQEPVTSMHIRDASTAVLAMGDGMEAVIMPVDPDKQNRRRNRHVKAAAAA